MLFKIRRKSTKRGNRKVQVVYLSNKIYSLSVISHEVAELPKNKLRW